MSKINIGINGFGRIGRQVYRAINERHSDSLQVTAINSLANTQQQAHLLKYDSAYGKYPGEVTAEDGILNIDGHKVTIFSQRDPAQIPWADADVQIVIESTGIFTDGDKAKAHINAGAEKVIISASAKNADATLVLGVNDNIYDPANHHVISNASCTTNCAAPMAKVLNDTFGIQHALLSTIHAYTNDQRILDRTHSDLRRARAAANSIIPTTTGAAKAVATVIPQLKGKIDGMAYRVPVITGSVTDLTAQLAKPASADEINNAFRTAQSGPIGKVLTVSDEPLVSVDYIGNPYSCIIDALSTTVIAEDASLSTHDRKGRFVKVVGWYDNEWGYSCRTADLAALIARDL